MRSKREVKIAGKNPIARARLTECVKARDRPIGIEPPSDGQRRDRGSKTVTGLPRTLANITSLEYNRLDFGTGRKDPARVGAANPLLDPMSHSDTRVD